MTYTVKVSGGIPGNILRRRPAAKPGTEHNMTIKLAYQVSYNTEYRDGRIETHDKHTRFFATRDQAIVHAHHLTDATETDGVFVGPWTRQFESFFAPEDTEEIRVTATIATLTLDEIEASL